MPMQYRDDQALDHPFSSVMTRKQDIVISLNKDLGKDRAAVFQTWTECFD